MLNVPATTFLQNYRLAVVVSSRTLNVRCAPPDPAAISRSLSRPAGGWRPLGARGWKRQVIPKRRAPRPLTPRPCLLSLFAGCRRRRSPDLAPSCPSQRPSRARLGSQPDVLIRTGELYGAD